MVFNSSILYIYSFIWIRHYSRLGIYITEGKYPLSPGAYKLVAKADEREWERETEKEKENERKEEEKTREEERRRGRKNVVNDKERMSRKSSRSAGVGIKVQRRWAQRVLYFHSTFLLALYLDSLWEAARVAWQCLKRAFPWKWNEVKLINSFEACLNKD